MLFGKKRNAPDITRNDPEVTREKEIERLELEHEALTAEIEQLLKKYASAIRSREPVKGAKPAGTQPNEYSYWHKEEKN